MIQLVLEGWLLGLSTGPYCLGACAPFVVPYLFAEGRSDWRKNAKVIGEFLLGRLLAYLLFGAIVGWIGGLLRPHLTQQIASASLGLTSLLLLVYAVTQQMPQWKICAWILHSLPRIRIPLLLGFLIGINVCPPFFVAVARLLQVGQITGGVIFFFGFFAGTTLYMLPLLGLTPLTSKVRFQRIGALSAILVAGWFLITAITQFLY